MAVQGEHVEPGAVPSPTPRRRVSTSARSWLVPVTALLTLVGLIGSDARAFLVVGVAVVALALLQTRLPAGPRAALATLLGVLVLGAGVIAHVPVLLVAGALAVGDGLTRAWGVNRGRRRGRAWAMRGLTLAGAVVAALFVVYPGLLAVGYLAKPRAPIREAALGLPHERIAFPASDGVRLSGWWVPSRNGAAVVVVHGGGGDREGAVRHARLLAAAGYGVLLYDARGRGRSGGDENAFGWRWDRDVRGAVDVVERRGIDRVGLLGLSTGAEAVVTEAAGDPRVRAVVADGVQGRSAADTTLQSYGDRVIVQPVFAALGAEIWAVRGERPPPPLKGLLLRLAAARPLLLVTTIPLERRVGLVAAAAGAHVWDLPDTPHTGGLERHPQAYRGRVLELFGRALRQ